MKPPKPTNIPSELADSPDAQLKYNPQDPETAELVKGLMSTASSSREFLAEKQGQEPEEPTAVEGRIDVPPNPEFSSDPTHQMITEALVPIDNLPLNDAEKELFLKAVLNDEPIRLPIVLYKGQLKVDMRSRSTFEQKRVFDIIELDQKSGTMDPANVALSVTRLQYYLAALMVERINDKLFSELKLVPGKTVEEDAAILRKFVAEKLESMTLIRWNSILNALRIFENKCAKLNSEAANEDFWVPHGSGS